MPKIDSAPTTVDGIRFRSKLEGEVYRQLKTLKVPCEYEPYKVVLQDKFRYDGQTVLPITYTPDFIVKPKKGHYKELIIEVKAYETDLYKIKRKLYLNMIKDDKEKIFIVVKFPRDVKRIYNLYNNINEPENTNYSKLPVFRTGSAKPNATGRTRKKQVRRTGKKK